MITSNNYSSSMVLLWKLKRMKQGFVDDVNSGICINVARRVFPVSNSQMILLLHKLFASFGLNDQYPVEEMYAKEKLKEQFHKHAYYSELHHSIRNKWSLKRRFGFFTFKKNPCAPYRHKLLDMLIEKLENEIEKFEQESAS
ncbi:hypothetical protein POP12_168 [Pectobacterium phage POP12]|nr:hypothetical protein POP12_168 [Pectobacterium phage POP12]